MAFTHIVDLEDAETVPGQKVKTIKNESGSDGVYSIDNWDMSYSERQVYITDEQTNSGNRALKHIVSRDLSTGEYTGTEAAISPPSWSNPVEGTEYWIRVMYYFSSDFSWRTGSNGTTAGGNREPKTFRVFYRDDKWTNSFIFIGRNSDLDDPTIGWMMTPADERYAEQYGNHWGICAEPRLGGYHVSYKAPLDNNYENFKIPKGRWVSFESYVYFSSTNGIARLWIDEKLLYEFSGFNNLTAQWTPTSNHNIPPNNRPSIQTMSTWGGLPYTGGVYYTDDFIFTTDESYATKIDSRGNKMIGRASGDNGGNNGDNKGPVITNISTQTGETSATITWDTDELSNSVVDYGATESRGTLVYGNDNTKKHVVELADLEVDTQYYYRLSSKDSAGNVTLIKENRTFTTGSKTEPVEASLDDLTDVSLTTPTKGQILIYDGTHWVNKGIDLDSMIENKVAEVLERAKIVVT